MLIEVGALGVPGAEDGLGVGDGLGDGVGDGAGAV